MPAGTPPVTMAYAAAPETAWPQSAAEAIRSRFFMVDAADRPEPRRRQQEVALPSRFALAALQMESEDADSGPATEILRLRPSPGTDWSDQGPIDAGQLMPIAGRFAPR
jgi:hypothetical protein